MIVYDSMRRYWCGMVWGKDDRKYVKVIWTLTKQAIRGTGGESTLNGI